MYDSIGLVSQLHSYLERSKPTKSEIPQDNLEFEFELDRREA